MLPQLLALPEELTTAEQREMWGKLLADLPPVPVAPARTADPRVQPAQTFTKPANSENTELYAVYPYRLYGVGKPDLEVAKAAYERRRFPGPTCWSWDPQVAALLGLTDDARKFVHANFTCTGARFQAFWKPGHDWIPDFDNGGAGDAGIAVDAHAMRGQAHSTFAGLASRLGRRLQAPRRPDGGPRQRPQRQGRRASSYARIAEGRCDCGAVKKATTA